MPAKLVGRLTAKLVDRLTAKLVVVNLVKLHLTKFNQLPRLSGRWVPGTPRGFHCGQPAPRWKTVPMAGKSPQPSHEPPFQAEGTLRADAARSERERGAQGWGKPWLRTTQVPRHPTRTTRKREKYVRNTCQVRRLATPTIVLTGL